MLELGSLAMNPSPNSITFDCVIGGKLLNHSVPQFVHQHYCLD